MWDPILLEAIREFPAEAGPRERLAARYDSEGDPRGNFIRVQLEKQNLLDQLELPVPEDQVAPTLDRVDRLEEQERSILAEYETSWRDELRLATGEISWDRGEVDLRLSWARWWERGETIAEHVAIRRLTLVDRVDLSFDRLLAWPPTARARELDFTDSRMRKQGFSWLVEALSSVRLSALLVGGNEISPQGLAALGASPHAEHLQFIDLSHNDLDAKGITALAGGSRFSSLSRLNLSNNRFGAKSACSLVASRALEHVTELSLAHNSLGSTGVVDLMRSPEMQRMTSLDLSGTGLGDNSNRGPEALANSRYTSALTSLAIGWTHLNPRSFETLARSPLLPRLRSLDLTAATMYTGLATALSSCDLTALRRLNCSCNSMGDEPIQIMFESTPWRRLLDLDLRRNELGSRAAQVLIQNRTLRPRRLDLSQNEFDASTLTALRERFGTALVVEELLGSLALGGRGRFRLRGWFCRGGLSTWKHIEQRTNLGVEHRIGAGPDEHASSVIPSPAADRVVGLGDLDRIDE